MAECPYECEGEIDEFDVCQQCGREVRTESRFHYLNDKATLDAHSIAYRAGMAAAASPLLAQWSPRIWRKGRYLAIVFILLIGGATYASPPEWMYSLIILAGYPVFFSLILIRVFGWGAFRIIGLEGSFGLLVTCPWAYEYGYADAKENFRTEVEYDFE